MSFLDDLLNSPQQLNAVGTGIEAGGAVVGGLSHIEFGQQAQQSTEFQAAQLRQNAGQAQASAQHAAYDVDRQAQYTASTALATEIEALKAGTITEAEVDALAEKVTAVGTALKAATPPTA